MRIKILGKVWTLSFVDGRTMPDAWGACERPDSPRKEIRIRKNLRGEKQLDVILHEVLHAADWTKDEEWVEQVATDIAAILWKLGYRKEHDGE